MKMPVMTRALADAIVDYDDRGQNRRSKNNFDGHFGTYGPPAVYWYHPLPHGVKSPKNEKGILVSDDLVVQSGAKLD